MVYEGEWFEGRYHGTGKLTTAIGEIYTGTFKNGKFMQ
jgi:hypothetical protein